MGPALGEGAGRRVGPGGGGLGEKDGERRTEVMNLTQGRWREVSHSGSGVNWRCTTGKSTPIHRGTNPSYRERTFFLDIFVYGMLYYYYHFTD